MSDWLGEALRERRGFGRAPHPADSIEDDDDGFSREARTLGVAEDLVDVARRLVPNADTLSGAALHSALEKAIADRPSLRVAASVTPEPPDGLDGGAGRGSGRQGETDMNALIRARAGHGPLVVGRHGNGLPESVG